MLCFSDSNEILHSFHSSDSSPPGFLSAWKDLKDTKMRFTDDESIVFQMDKVPETV